MSVLGVEPTEPIAEPYDACGDVRCTRSRIGVTEMPLHAVNLRDKLSKFSEHWSPKVSRDE